MKPMILASLGVAATLMAGCGRSDDAARARDLQLLQAQRMNPQLVSPMEMGIQGQPGYGPQQGYYYPQGYYPQPPQAYYPTPNGYYPVPAQPQPVYGPQPVYAPAPQPVYRTASTSRTTAQRSGTVARAPVRVTHTKRDAVIGAAAGAVTGAVIGRNVKGAVIGAAAGGVLGAVVGSTVDVDHR